MNAQVSGSSPRTAFCGPISGVPTGQRAALLAAIAAVGRAEAAQVDTGGSGLLLRESICKALTAMATLALEVGWRRVRTIYITPSRTVLGAVRELPLVLIARISGSRLIAHWHGAEFHYLRHAPGCLLARLLRLLWSRADTHVALCDTMRVDLEHFGFRDVRVIPNFCDLPTQVSAPTTSEYGQLRLLYFSNLIPEKGIHDAIRTHHALLRSGRATELHVVGARLGPLPEVVEHALRSEGVVYHGALYGPQKYAVLASCDVLLFPSVYRSEAFPLTLLEAMSTGLAVVAYRHNYIADFFESAGGYLVSCRPEAMVEAVTSLFDDPRRLYEFKTANRLAAQVYSTEAYQSKIRMLLKCSDH